MDIPDSHFKTPSGTDNNKNNNTNNSSKLINPSSSDSTAVQDSPIYNFISNLSPIQPVKAAPVAQGFPGLASPPLIFASPRISSQTSFLNRQLRSPIPDSTFSEHNYKCQNKEDHPDDLANLNLNLKSPSAGGDKTSYSRKSSVEAAPFRASGFRDELFANPMECTDSSIRKLFADSPQSSRGHCLEQKDNTAMEDKSLDGSAMPRVTENAQTKTTTSVKLVKLEPKRMISASSGGCRIFTRLSSGHPSEASNLESGSLRRCLFDENQRKYMSDGSGSRSAKDEFMSIQEVANTSSGTVEASQIVSLSKPMTGVSPSPTARNYPVAISKPLGIGLHLNSVVYPRSLDNATGGQQSSEIVARETRKTSMFVASIQPAGKVNISSVPSNSVGEVPSCSEQTQQNQAFSVTASDNPLASDAAENMKDLILVKTDDPPAMLNDKRKFNSEPVEPNMLNLGSPRKKRKKLTTPPDDDSSKRCNCRRSKCLKLYCDCFAAGMYCGESCACQGCSNRSEYEHTVLETRQQIESRNPLAFAPKVVQPVIDSHSSGKEVENFSTPSSARHKRGCNCKRSMCLKKYCECYQSNVGCSDGCRCEGCKNVYGKREDYTFPREFMTKKVDNETQGGLIDEKQQSFSANSDNTKTRIHSSPQVTPVTPALQCSDQRKNALKSQLSFQRFLRSPDSNHDVPSKDFSAHPENSPIHSMLLEDSGRSMDVSSSKPNDLRNVSGPQTSAGSGLPPSSSHLCSRSSPKTPITESGRPEFIPEIGSGSKRYSQMVEDETPEILKDSVTPSESVKVRSPNKKRVSPPYNHNKASSDSLRICQKFVLHAVSSLQPLTPLSRKSNNENPSEPID